MRWTIDWRDRLQGCGLILTLLIEGVCCVSLRYALHLYHIQWCWLIHSGHVTTSLQSQPVP